MAVRRKQALPGIDSAYRYILVLHQLEKLMF
jgi:hypothetical protein